MAGIPEAHTPVIKPKLRFDFANLAKSATEDNNRSEHTRNRNLDAQIISHVMLNMGALR